MQTETKLQYEVRELKTKKLPVIIVAAGNSTRMGTNKQFMRLSGLPVIARTIAAFENSQVIDRIILVVKADDVFSYEILVKKYGFQKITDIVCGGKTRAESVLKGFERLPVGETRVLIHDGARPLVSERIIVDVASSLEKCAAVTCAVKVKDTIKQVDENGKIIKTLDRNTLVAVQTPQGVRVKDYLYAIDKIGNVASYTDDTSIMEKAGFECFCVEGSYKNLKITTPEDINTAESYLKEEGL